jgi:glycosyltransferase involved in cell wall biosynthesis
VGRLRYYKGLDVLIDAMADVPGGLAIIGSGPMQAVWRTRAQGSPAAARIHFQGEVSEQELAAYYAAADVLVLPSTQRAETFGLVQLEAMAAGVPVISTELGTGTSFVNLDGETGRIVPPGDVGALAAALNELLGSTDHRTRMGQAGRQRVEAVFHIDTTVERTTQLYREVLAKREG